MRILIIMLFIMGAVFSAAQAQGRTLAPQEIQTIAEQVYQNECAGKEENLLQWNEGEEFMSIGIGHFIWYPQGPRGPFEEGAPRLFEYLKLTGEELPAWLQVSPVPVCPWGSRENFLRDRQGPKANELRQVLSRTKTRQGEFLVLRLNLALPLMLESVPEQERERIRSQFNRLAAIPAGVYALVDYVNFKGTGVSPTERYQGKGWGLLQILSAMQVQDGSRQALEEFVRIADQLLTERVKNSPPERKEDKWLPGWQSRLKSYLEFPGKR